MPTPPDRPLCCVVADATPFNDPQESTLRLIESARAWASHVKRDGMTLWYAASHPGTPWYAKALGLFVVGYALSPIDLIPDFIPVLGLLDDVILLPALIWLTVRLLPPDVRAECRAKAEKWMNDGKRKPRSKAAAVVIVLLWLAMGAGLCWWLYTTAGGSARQ